jgi:hypothetical protein
VTTATKTRAVKTSEVQEWDDEWLVRRGNYLTLITPELAKVWLEERNVNNRKLKARAIANYARDMAAGHWDPDASDIKFARTGELIDGQNRLAACIEAGVAFPTLVRTGLSLKAKQHVDTGQKRNVADVLRMQTEIRNYASQVGAAVTLWVRYADRVNNHAGRRLSNFSGGGSNNVVQLTHDEILAFLEEHPGIPRYAGDADRVRRQVMPAIVGSSLNAWMGMCSEIDEDLLRQINDQLISGEFGGPGDPLQALVQYAAMVRGRTEMGNAGKRGRVQQESHLHALSRVWNAIRAGERIENRITIKITDRLVLPA